MRAVRLAFAGVWLLWGRWRQIIGLGGMRGCRARWQKNGEIGCGIFNGDIGLIISVLVEDEVLLIDFEGRLTRYDFTMLDELEHAYAITVHKSQGSEYPFVIIPIYNCTEKLLTRNLLYTAVTRAKELLIIVGDDNAVASMTHNDRKQKRYSGLKARLQRSH